MLVQVEYFQINHIFWDNLLPRWKTSSSMSLRRATGKRRWQGFSETSLCFFSIAFSDTSFSISFSTYINILPFFLFPTHLCSIPPAPQSVLILSWYISPVSSICTLFRLKVPPLGNVSDPALSIKVSIAMRRAKIKWWWFKIQVGFFGGCICVLMLLIIGTATIMHKQRWALLP